MADYTYDNMQTLATIVSELHNIFKKFIGDIPELMSKISFNVYFEGGCNPIKIYAQYSFLDTVDISVQVSKNKEYLNHMVYSLLGNLAFCVCKKTYSSSKVCNKHMDLLIKTIEVKKNWF